MADIGKTPQTAVFEAFSDSRLFVPDTKEIKYE